MPAPLDVGTTAERAVLGAALHGRPATVALLLRDLPPDAFSDPRLRVVAGVLHQVSQAGRGCDPQSVAAEADRLGLVERRHLATFAALLFDLLAEVAVPMQGPTFARGLAVEWSRRQAVEATERIVRAAQAGSAADLVAAVSDSIGDLQDVVERLSRVEVAA
jgi:replicative DNA helicase